MKMTESNDKLIQNGDRVVLRKDKNIQIAMVQKNKKYNLEKMWFEMSGAIGQPYGTVFEVKGKKISPVEEEGDQIEAFSDRLEQGKDNRNIVDDSASQKLSREEIEQLRKQGEKGQEVVRQLVENSSSFKEKTVFSQEKYIRKKNKKHLHRFRILRPSTRLIAEMYFNKGPARINFLRVDALAQMLAYGNVRAGTRQLVVESCNGLLLAATLERMAEDPGRESSGLIVQLHQEQDPPRQALEGYPFHSEQLKMLHHLPLKFLAKVKNQSLEVSQDEAVEEGENDPDTCPTPSKKPRLDDDSKVEPEVTALSTEEEKMQTEGEASAKTDPKENKPRLDDDSKVESEDTAVSTEAEKMQTEGEASVEKKCETETEQNADAEPQKEDCECDTTGVSESMNGKGTSQGKGKGKSVDPATLELRRQQRRNQIDETIEILRGGDFDSLLIAARVHPTPIAVRLLEYLKDSSPVCIFSPYKEPLIDCYQRLRDSGHVVHLRLSETWLRNYQVLPNRTHPEINMSTNGGYLLTFIKVSSQPAAPSRA